MAASFFPGDNVTLYGIAKIARENIHLGKARLGTKCKIMHRIHLFLFFSNADLCMITYRLCFRVVSTFFGSGKKRFGPRQRMWGSFWPKEKKSHRVEDRKKGKRRACRLSKIHTLMRAPRTTVSTFKECFVPRWFHMRRSIPICCIFEIRRVPACRRSHRVVGLAKRKRVWTETVSDHYLVRAQMRMATMVAWKCKRGRIATESQGGADPKRSPIEPSANHTPAQRRAL